MMKLVVLGCLLAVASSAVVAPFGALAYGAPWVTPYYGNYRGPLSLAPGQPANILAADGRPLDTLDVNLDRSAHYVSKALTGHFLKKRSVAVAPVVAPITASRLTVAHAAPWAAPYTTWGAWGARVAPLAPYVASPWITHW